MSWLTSVAQSSLAALALKTWIPPARREASVSEARSTVGGGQGRGGKTSWLQSPSFKSSCARNWTSSYAVQLTGSAELSTAEQNVQIIWYYPTQPQTAKLAEPATAKNPYVTNGMKKLLAI
jgi:hypothetical protein